LLDHVKSPAHELFSQEHGFVSGLEFGFNSLYFLLEVILASIVGLDPNVDLRYVLENIVIVPNVMSIEVEDQKKIKVHHDNDHASCPT
jgi:hypothetical protein